MPDVDERLVLTPQEVAAMLRVSSRHVYEMVQQGEIRAVRLGRRVLIPAAAVDELLAGPTKTVAS